MVEDTRRWFPVGELATASDSLVSAYLQDENSSSFKVLADAVKAEVQPVEASLTKAIETARLDAINRVSVPFGYTHIHTDWRVGFAGGSYDQTSGLAIFTLKLTGTKKITWDSVRRKLGNISASFAPTDISFSGVGSVRASGAWSWGIIEVMPDGGVFFQNDETIGLSTDSQINSTMIWKV